MQLSRHSTNCRAKTVIEGYCRELEGSTTQDCRSYPLYSVARRLSSHYIRKRLLNRLNLEQILEINKKYLLLPDPCAESASFARAKRIP